MRWNHPVRGFVPPDDFIAVAEQTGVIGALTDWVLTRALASAALARRGLDMPIAVNISPRVLRDADVPRPARGDARRARACRPRA